jgi:hypothetical protein
VVPYRCGQLVVEQSSVTRPHAAAGKAAVVRCDRRRAQCGGAAVAEREGVGGGDGVWDSEALGREALLRNAGYDLNLPSQGWAIGTAYS